MVNNRIENKINFIKKNPAVIYSLVLIAAVTGALILNTYYSLAKFQEGVDYLVQKKAVLGEDIFRILAVDLLENRDLLQKKIIAIKNQDSEARRISVLVPSKDGDKFNIIASSNSEEIGQESEDGLNSVAWGVDQGFAKLGLDGDGRYWEVTKVIKDESNRGLGLVSFQLSLDEYDQLMAAVVRQVYVFSLVSLLVVLLLIANHMRLFGYAVRATKLEEVDKMKDDFISMASHELRTPITALKGYLELVKDGLGRREDAQADQEAERYVSNMETSLSRLNDLVEDILEVSRLNQNRLPINPQKVDISKTISVLAEEMRLLAGKKGLELIYSQEKLSEVSADPERVKQILVNLLGNAVKYSLKGKVEIKTKEDAKNVFITVADTGIGISAEDFKNLFTKFYRVQNDRTMSISGTGLGLWISRELALKMGGDLSVESIEGVGSHFTLKLKKAKNGKHYEKEK